jgi:2TM domain
MATLSDDEAYKAAREQMLEIKGFYGHLAAFILVNAGLFILNMLTSPHQIWFIWPLFGWGFGLAAHAISVYSKGSFMGRAWEERKTREIMERTRENA